MSDREIDGQIGQVRDRFDERKICRRTCVRMLFDPVARCKIKEPDQVLLTCFKECRNISLEIDKFELPKTK